MTENSNERPGFVFLRGYRETLRALDKQPEMKLKLFEAIVDYGLDGTIPEDPILAAFIQSMKISIDKSNETYRKREVDRERKRKEREEAKNGQERTDADNLGQVRTSSDNDGQARTDSDSDGQTRTSAENRLKEKGERKKEKGEGIKEKGESANAESARAKKAAPKSFYGSFKNVLLTDEEHQKLEERFPYDLTDRIDALSEGIASKGYKYKSHYAAILSWARADEKRAVEKAQEKIKHEAKQSKEDEEWKARVERFLNADTRAGTIYEVFDQEGGAT